MKYKFEDIIFNITEKKKPSDEDKLNYIGLEHLESGSLFINSWGSERTPDGEKIVMKKGDVLFGKRRAYQKKVAISPCDGIFSAHGMVLRPKEDVICKDFLPFFISSDTFLNEAIRISVGGLSPTINWKDIKELEFELPSIEDQKIISDKLWAAYELKRSYQDMIKATDEMVKSQFIEMFGGHSTVVKLKDVVTIMDDKRKPINEGERSAMKDGELYPYYGATGVVDYINDYLTDERLLCIAEDCGNYGPGEESSYIIEGKAWVNNHAHVVKPNDELCDITYLHNYLKVTDLLPFVSGTTRKKLTQKAMSDLDIILPQIDKQREYVSICDQADKSKLICLLWKHCHCRNVYTK